LDFFGFKHRKRGQLQSNSAIPVWGGLQLYRKRWQNDTSAPEAPGGATPEDSSPTTLLSMEFAEVQSKSSMHNDIRRFEINNVLK
jgi:hypothetical protein